MDSSTRAFQALKPVCVALGEAAKGLSEGKSKASAVENHLQKLKRTLLSETARSDALHSKLAEYIFFPISQVLRVSQKASIQCLELCLQCISVLVDQGWREQLPRQTAAQLVILCTLLAEKKPQGLPFADTTEELQGSAFWCLFHIFSVVGESREAKQLLTSEAHFPQLGKTISVALEAIEDPGRSTSQVAASQCLEALVIHMADREIHGTFLPGIVSKLTKVLTPSTKGRTNSRVLIQCLNIVKTLLQSTLGEQDNSASDSSQVTSNKTSAANSVINDSWQRNAAAQLKPALGSIMRLKSHGNDEVRQTLGRVCLTILRTCRKTLVSCSDIALDTIVTLCAHEQYSGLRIEFEMLLQVDGSIASSLQSLLHSWLQSLPVIISGADEHAKANRLRKISAAHEALVESNVNMGDIDRTIVTALRDSIVTTLTLPGASKEAAPLSMPLHLLDLAIEDDNKNATKFESALVRHRGQQGTIDGIHSFIEAIVDRGVSVELRNGLARSLRQSSEETQIASFWLLLEVCKRSQTRQNESDPFLLLEGESSCLFRDELEEIYSLALTVLTAQAGEPYDPRLQALALEALALRAKSEGENFRYELLDALYPVLHTLATPDEMLQRASIATLNIVTSSCGYGSVKELVVDNVDYLTNAVALKLNAFDVSPQAPQVLLMMLRLAGPSLLPYMEDTVDSIFAALEDYHGYPALVELLFRVLSVMAEEGVKAPQLAIEWTKKAEHGDSSMGNWTPTTIGGLAMLLRIRARDEIEAAKEEEEEKGQHAQRPWADEAKQTSDEDDDELAESEHDQSLKSSESGPPASKTYNLLLRITELTQHFLPSASPSLRTSLMGLIRTTAPALAKHENSFLPLINTLWPEIVSRLDDEEAHIMTTALDIVRVLCECAGDFMRTRIAQLWPRLVEIYRNVARDLIISASSPSQSRGKNRASTVDPHMQDERLRQVLMRAEQDPAGYGDKSAREIWSALQSVMAAIVQHVRMSPEYNDEALDMVGSSIGRTDALAAFEDGNSDAVWLARLKAGFVEPPTMPMVAQGQSWCFAAVAA